ncbi:MAG: hypothetical protein JNJ85_04585 [Candidatus Kapabacteria bacterium]|nr:hypothetical protein [Candidatus Kapabacteria bacterium]MBX7153666.1 hypothetical protein [Bacteroidota bacterium]
MESVLSISFNKNRTYVVQAQYAPKGLHVTHIDVIRDPIDVSTDAVVECEGAFALLQTLTELPSKPHHVYITLPTDVMMIHTMPAVPFTSADEVRDMVTLEIIQHAPEKNLDDYAAEFYTLTPRLDGSEIIVAVLTERTAIERVQKLLTPAGLQLTSTIARQFAAHASFRYNYPEWSTKAIAVFGITDNHIETSVLNRGELSYYNSVPFAHSGSISDICDSEIEKILSAYAPFLDGCFLYGDDVTKEILTAVQLRLAGLLPSIERLNGFRMTTTSLDSRHKEYCTRMAHVYVPGTGAVIPQFHKPTYILDSAVGV